MRKHFLILMLMALLPLAGWAQGGGILAPNSYFKNGNFVYKVLTSPVANGAAGTAQLVGVRDGYNPVVNGALQLDGNFSIVVLEDNYSLVVTEATEDALRNNYDLVSGILTNKGEFSAKTTATSVVIPKEFKTIVANTFVGYTNLASISFEEGSVVETIQSGAFTTTQISNFDFSNCSKLTTIQAGLFVEEIGGVKQMNSYIETISLPIGSEVLTSIGTAFQNLPNLTALNNLDQTKITTVAAEAFNNDTKLETLALPATVQTIAATAFQGSGVKDLTIDVTSLNDGTAGNVYGTSKATLESLTLKGVLSKTFKSEAFKGCTNLASITMNDATKPFVINGGTIGASAFEGCTKLTSLTFNNITNGIIDDDAFKGCTGLTTVVFGTITGTDLVDAVIDDNAFNGCTALANITFGNLQYVTIGESAFEGCGTATTATTSVLTFNGLTEVDIEDAAFKGCSKLTSIIFGAANGLTINDEAFAGCTKATSLSFNTLKNVTIGEIGAATTKGAFYNANKLQTIIFGTSENLTINTYAFEDCAKSSAAAAELTFGNAKNLQILANAFKGMTKVETITFSNIEDDLIPSDEIAASAFEGATNLKSLTFGNLTGVEIKKDAFKTATSLLDGNDYATAQFGNLVGSTIEDGSFAGVTRLAIVKIGDVTEGSKIGTTTTPTGVFSGLKKATIGTVRGGDDVIGTNAFTFGNFTAATLNLAYVPATTEAAAAVKLLEYTNAGDVMIAADAFDFTATTGAGFTSFTKPVVNIGEIKSADALAAGALKGSKIEKINFKGDIAANGLNNMIIVDNAGVAAALELNTLVFDGAIAAAGIATNAFANLPQYMTITFNGKLAAGAIADAAFDALKGDFPVTNVSKQSRVNYTYDGADIDVTVNPFAQTAFAAGSTTASNRIIELVVTNEALKAKFFGATATTGLGTNGAFDIFCVIVEMPAPPVDPDWSMIAYQDQANQQNVAWARWEFGAKALNETVAPGKEITIQRVQNKYTKSDGTEVTGTIRVTLYGTYTDEDDFNQKTSIYMVPLKAIDGEYVIPGDNYETLIAKVELKEGNFTTAENDGIVKVAVSNTTSSETSIWGGLQNTELFCASNIMTNQQLIDKTAVDAATDIAAMKGVAGDNAGDYLADATALDASGIFHNERNCTTVGGVNIYRSTTVGSDDSKVAEDLYRMRDPKAKQGFEIVKNAIQKGGAYIGTGVYYMLLKKYENAPAYAHVVWLDDDQATGIFGVKSDVNNIATVNNAVYTLQGIRVNQLQKGQLYIMNGKKFIAK